MSLPTPDIAPINISCPHKSVLGDYLQGLADDSTAASVDLHLDSCKACNQILSQMEVDLLPTLAQIQDETEKDLSLHGLVDEDEVIRQAIASSKVPASPGNAAWYSATLNPVREQVGPYRLIRPIGRGGMGSVYQAEHKKLHRDVALKLLPLGMANPCAIERFEREIHAAGKLNHPAIVTSTDAGTDAGYLYLAMELIPGFDLGKIARLFGPLCIADVCEIGRQIALGLAHAHQMGMVHRDIKPSNVMLDSTGNVKLLDFGLVMLNQWDSPLGELTTVGQFLGTLDYMAPEQAERSASVDHRSDLYSLGATLFRLLTGQLPVAILPNQSPLEKLRVLSNHEPLKVTTLRADVPEPLAKLIDQLLKTNPCARPASAAHVAEALEVFCSNADLLGLANRAEQLPEEMDNGPREGQDNPHHPVANARLDGKSAKNWFRIWPSIAVAFFPFLAYLGWTVIIENSKGNLVIQSEVEGLQVHIAAVDGTKNDSLTIIQGTSLTRLQAGDYEIKLDSASDAIILEPERIVLKRGETVLANIRRETPNSDYRADEPAAGPYAESSPDWLPTGLISEEYRYASFKGKTILDHLRQIHLERDYQTWLVSLATIEKALPSHEKAKLSPFIQASAERNGFLTGLNWFRFVQWVPYEQIDAKIAQWLGNHDDHVLSLIQECLLKVSIEPLGARQVEWTRLPLTWQATEDWLANDGGLQRRLLVRQQSKSSLLSFIPHSDPLNKYLYENYPRTAFGIAQYYGNPANTFGFQSISQPPPSDPEAKAIRLNARLKLVREAIATENLHEILWQLDSIYVRTDSEEDSEESEHLTLIAGFIAQRMELWAASNDMLLKNMIQIQMSTYERNSWSVMPEAVKRFYHSFGGMGGGMGGMGGMGDLPAATIGQVFVSESIELLAAYQRLPESLQPRTVLEKVRAMLADKDRELSGSLQEIFNGEWMNFSWTSEMKLQRSIDGSSKTQQIPLADQNRAIAFVLYRWIDGLLESDFKDPGRVVTEFFRQLTAGPTQSSEGQTPSSWIHSSQRDQWDNRKILSKLPFMDQAWFEPSSISANMDLATVVGKLGAKSDRSNEFRVRLRLEREGWRIQSIVWFPEGELEAILLNPGP